MHEREGNQCLQLKNSLNVKTTDEKYCWRYRREIQLKIQGESLCVTVELIDASAENILNVILGIDSRQLDILYILGLKYVGSVWTEPRYDLEFRTWSWSGPKGQIGPEKSWFPLIVLKMPLLHILDEYSLYCLTWKVNKYFHEITEKIILKRSWFCRKVLNFRLLTFSQKQALNSKSCRSSPVNWNYEIFENHCWRSEEAISGWKGV